jgi:hypothetical protein
VKKILMLALVCAFLLSSAIGCDSKDTKKAATSGSGTTPPASGK